MKNYNILLALLLIVLACSAPKKETPEISGAYNMLRVTTRTDGNATVREGVQQLKIFTKQYMMYVLFDENNPDGTSFGIGTYVTRPGGITEHVIYSASGGTVNTTGGVYELEIEMKPNGYQQVINDVNEAGEEVISTELYESVGTNSTSPLDGMWREIRTYNIEEGDTSLFTMTQYKAYFAGHFMYGHTFEDATTTGATHTGMGFGTFEMIGDTLTREVVTVSTYENSGRTYNIQIEFNGPDEYKQTITEENGVKNVEIYRRMEKQPL